MPELTFGAPRMQGPMLQRITYGVLLIALIFLLTALDAVISLASRGGAWWAPLRRGSAIPITLAGLSLVACLELSNLCRAAGLRPHSRWAALMCLVLVVSPWLAAAGWLGPTSGDVDGLPWQLIWVFLTIFGTAVLHLTVRSSAEGAVGDITATWGLVLYAGLLPSFLVVVRCDVSRPGPIGAWLVLIYLLVTKASDIGAYFVGSLFGRHKLIPRFSPAKSYEGAFGGVLGSVAAMLALLTFGRWASGLAAEYANAPAGVIPLRIVLLGHAGEALASLRTTQALVFAVLMSIVGQVGDLLESILKRSAHAKDSAKLVPSFGGVLDMVDSVFMTAPVAWLVLWLS